MSRGLLIVVSGPAGSGKGTVNSQLVATGDFVFSVSATTRAPRPGEINGINYHFIELVGERVVFLSSKNRAEDLVEDKCNETV